MKNTVTVRKIKLDEKLIETIQLECELQAALTIPKRLATSFIFDNYLYLIFDIN
ncbi:MAG TPA: hypothetical protein PLA71_00730 [Saccharofermentans sp.]|nr:hypothetical protein [Saccharofermentans sp.]